MTLDLGSIVSGSDHWADQLENLYANLRKELGVGGFSPAEKLEIENIYQDIAATVETHPEIAKLTDKAEVATHVSSYAAEGIAKALAGHEQPPSKILNLLSHGSTDVVIDKKSIAAQATEYTVEKTKAVLIDGESFVRAKEPKKAPTGRQIKSANTMGRLGEFVGEYAYTFKQMSTRDKVANSIQLAFTGLIAVSALNHLSHAAPKDENGQRHLQLNQLAWGGFLGAIAAGMAFMAHGHIKDVRGGGRMPG